MFWEVIVLAIVIAIVFLGIIIYFLLRIAKDYLESILEHLSSMVQSLMELGQELHEINVWDPDDISGMTDEDNEFLHDLDQQMADDEQTPNESEE